MTDMAETVQNIYFQLSKPYALLMLAFTLDLCIGDPVWFPHPVRIIGKAITKIEELLRKHLAKHRAQNTEIKEKRTGTVLVVIIASSTYSLFYVLNSALLNYHFPLFISCFSLLVIVFLTAATLAAKGLIDSAQSIIKAVMDENLKGARIRLSHIVGRDTDTLDEKGILKATIESLAENASDGIIAPLFYFAIGGLPLAMTYKAINTMDSMVGYKSEKYKNFGWAAAKLDDIANYIPARITGILIVISSAFISHSLSTVHCSLKTMFGDGRNHPSPNSGMPEAAIAGALGVRLGGPSTYNGILVEKPCIGEERQNTEHRTQNTDNFYLRASEKAISITRSVSLLGFIIAATILYVRTTI